MSDPVAVHSFLSHLRTGLGARILPPANGPFPVRRDVEIAVEVNGDPGRSATAHVELFGPVDALGIDAGLVVRTDPAAGAFDVEPNYLPAIEFDPPDLPWRLSPLPETDGRVLPWLTLIVLSDDEFARIPGTAGRPAAITVSEPTRTLPRSDQRWAWAHVQVARRIEDPDAGPVVIATQTSEPARVVSRLLCPRRLHPITQYHAFVVPSFEAGRLAGLGLEPGSDGAAASWSSASPPGLALPVYYEWTFRTGRGGDFESLVRRLAPRTLDDRVGTRELTVGRQEYSIPAVAQPVPLDSALRHVSAAPPPMPDLSAFTGRLMQVLNAPADLVAGQAGNARVLAPPLYAMWHAQQLRVQAAGTPPPPWLAALNLDPRRRAEAGLGAEVVRRKQEDLMAEAWRQVGDVERANEALRRAQLGRAASARIWQRTLTSAPAATVAAMTRQLQPRVRTRAAAGTVAGALAVARLPGASLQPAMRRLSAPRGAIGRRLALGDDPQVVRRLNAGEIAAAGPPPQRPAGMIDISDGIRRGPVDHGPLGPVVGPTGGSGGFLGPSAAGEPGAVIGPVDPEGTSGEGEPAFHAFREAVRPVLTRLLFARAPAPATAPADLADLRDDLLAGLDPAATIVRRVLNTINEVRPTRPPTTPPPVDPIEPIMAAPAFPQPMYAPLRDLTPEHLLAGLAHVPVDTLALVRTNRPYVEAYLAGLNHEMSRELLWRGYPTDQRGTYFSRFFDAPDPEITPIHTWSPPSALGDHEAGSLTVDEPLVLLIRGELLRRYPTAVIYAVKARWDPAAQRRDLDESETQTPLFRGTLPADVTFVGFDLTPERVHGSLDTTQDQGWFFVIQEQPTEPRFGFDDAEAAAASPPTAWNTLSWGHFADDDDALASMTTLDLDVDPPHWPWPFDGTGDPPIRWRSHAADMAIGTLQQPVRVAVHASRMLP